MILLNRFKMHHQCLSFSYYCNVMNYVKRQLDPGLHRVSIRYGKIKDNYPFGDIGQDHSLLICPSNLILSQTAVL